MSELEPREDMAYRLYRWLHIERGVLIPRDMAYRGIKAITCESGVCLVCPETTCVQDFRRGA